MTSSSSSEPSCTLILRQDGAPVFELPVRETDTPARSSGAIRLPTNRSIELTLRRGRTRSLFRVVLESEELMRLQPERREWTLQLGELLRDQYGLADLTVQAALGAGAWRSLHTVSVAVEGDPAFRRLHEALVAELEDVHTALAHDIVSRTWQRRGGGQRTGAFRVENDLEKLREIYWTLKRAFGRIGEQPTRVLRRRRALGRWRPGDVVGTCAVHRLALEGDVRRDASGALVFPRKVLLDRPELVADIEEHRHLRAGVVRLAERSASIARYCRRAVRLLEEEEGRWSEEVLSQKIFPKIAVLERIQLEADELQGRIRRLIGRFPFLDKAGPPRTNFGPTPLFLGRPAYRHAYRALLEGRRYIGSRYDSDVLRSRFRNLATLYEYWLFVKVVGLLREMYGAPAGDGQFALIDELYRPELTPGQEFVFRLPQGDLLKATYEPDFPPVAARARERHRAAFATAPLRPDVTLELAVPGRPPFILALDAKSGPRFRKIQERLQQTAGYLWQVHDPATGHQPIRQLFLVHRDLETPPVSNVTGYLEGRVSPPSSRVLGAVPAQPGSTDALQNVILRFLETFRPRRWRR